MTNEVKNAVNIIKEYLALDKDIEENEYLDSLRIMVQALESQQNLTNEELYQSFINLEAENERLHDALESQRWIPVSERLPKAGEYIGDVERYYLVQNEYGDMLVARYTHGGCWEQIYQLQPIGDEIVAWMPLPESYKPESEE